MANAVCDYRFLLLVAAVAFIYIQVPTQKPLSIGMCFRMYVCMCSISLINLDENSRPKFLALLSPILPCRSNGFAKTMNAYRWRGRLFVKFICQLFFSLMLKLDFIMCTLTKSFYYYCFLVGAAVRYPIGICWSPSCRGACLSLFHIYTCLC